MKGRSTPKILFILPLPPPYHGSSVISEQLSRSRVLNQSFECHFINLSTSRTICEIGRKPFRKIYRYVVLLFNVIHELWTFRPALCYIAITAKGIGFYKDALIALVVKIFGVRIVYHFHNKGASTRQNYMLDDLAYRLTFHDSYAIILSNRLHYDIRKYFPKDKVFVCPNGIAALEVDLKRRSELTKPPEISRLLFLSNLIESKGVFVLLEACRILAEKRIAYICTYVGNEGDVRGQELLFKVHELGLDDRVEYLGAKYGSEKEQILQTAGIFVFPSYYDYECMPLVIMEAMQHGLPVVSTSEGAIPDLVIDGTTGFLVSKNNPEELAERLEVLIRNPELCKKMGDAGRLRYDKNFSLKEFENRIVSILSSILESENA